MRKPRMCAARLHSHFALRCRASPVLLAVLLPLLVLPMGCRQPSMPASFSSSKGKITAWDNAHEGFSLVLSEMDGRTQGFLAWKERNLYGRIGAVSRSSGRLELTLADGGMNGLKFEAPVVRDSLVLERSGSEAVKAQQRAHRLQLAGGSYPSSSGRGTKSLHATGMSTAGGNKTTWSTAAGETALSMRLQYLSSRNGNEAALLDMVLRRGAGPSMHAADRFAQQSEAVRKSADDARQDSPRPFFSREYEEIEYPVFLSDRYLCVATSHYLFEGGAHGNAATSFDVIDLVQGRRLGIGEVLRQEQLHELVPHIEQALIRQFEALGREARGEPGDLRSYGLFESDLPAPNDFFICKAGLCVQYDRYEIAPWSEGEFIVLVPWEEIKNMLASDFVLP